MPIGHAAVRKLREPENTFLVEPALLPEKTPIHLVDVPQAFFSNQRPEKIPGQYHSVGQRSQTDLVAPLGPRDRPKLQTAAFPSFVTHRNRLEHCWRHY
jgi:hypothetical protein